jgi:hypothetical protein
MDFGGLDFSDNLGNMAGRKKETLFLRRFTPDDLREIMDEVGMIQHLKKKGFDDLLITISIDETAINYMKVYDKELNPDSLLMDLRLSESKFVPDKRFFDNADDVVTYDMIVIEWLSAQNPRVNFSNDKPQLPGQDKPGLGILNFCFEMMFNVAKEIKKDGFLDVPDHMHGSIMYSKKFSFFDPVQQAILKAVLRDLKEYSLSDISWGMITETIIDKYKKTPQKYDPAEQIFYVSNRLKNYYKSKTYRALYNKYYRRKRYYFDYEEMVRKRDEILKKKDIVDL